MDLPMTGPASGRTDVVLPDPPERAVAALRGALEHDGDERRRAIADVAAAHPTFLDAWARLAEVGRDPVERYAYARVGYHRGLDAMRRHGWGGTGFLRWAHPTNRGALRCLARLRDAAAEIGETAEVRRLDEFLHDLDPDWDDRQVG